MTATPRSRSFSCRAGTRSWSLVAALGSGLALHAVPCAGELAPTPEIGWCAFYPYVDVGMDALPGSGATIMSVCSGGWGMEQVQGRFDFSPLEAQIACAEQHGLKLALINEINPVYAPEWLRRLAREAGEAVVGPGGGQGPIPSTTSRLFGQAQEEVVRRSVEFVKQRDRNGVVRYYHPGAEWWFPLGERYNPADVARFRAWLRARYGSIGALNARWQARFESFDGVPAPRLDSISPSRGNPGLATLVSLDEGAEHCSWSTSVATDPAAEAGPDSYGAVTPGSRYTASAWVRTEDLRGHGAFVEIAWVGPRGGAPVALDDGVAVRGTGDWRRIEVTARAPNDAGRAWILLKVMGSGTASFDDVELRENGTGPNLAPNPGFDGGGEAPAGWAFQDWAGGQRVVSEFAASGGRTSPGCVRIHAPRPVDGGPVYGCQSAAVHDWSVYWYEAAAEYINGLSRLTKGLDPSRPTVTYLTMAWAFGAEWDETQRSAIAPDEVGMRGEDVDIFGLQLCSADGDPFRITACLDLMRKYDKPLWAVDLVDFTSGVQIGYPMMDRITQATLQHGASGIIYCAWHIPSVLDYSYFPGMAAGDVTAMLSDARASVRLMEGMRVSPTGALVQPILPASPGDAEGQKNDRRSFMGWYKVLESLHQTFDVVTLREIEQGRADLAQYEYIVVPDCAYLQPEVLARLGAYAREGGRLVTGGRFAEFDEIGRPQAPGAGTLGQHALADHGLVYCGDPVRDTHAGNTPPLFLWRPETPVTRRAFRDARAALGSIFRTTRVSQPVALVPADRDLRCVVYTGQGQRAAYLVNLGEAPVVEGTRRLRLRSEHPGAVRVYADTRPVEVARRGWAGGVEVTLPAFCSSCMVFVAQ